MQNDTLITAGSGVIVAIVTAWATVRAGKQPSTKDSHEKAVAVSTVVDNARQIELLWSRVDELTNNLDVLREEKAVLEATVARLKDDLLQEKKDHRETRRRLTIALKSIADKERQIKEMEGKINNVT